MAGRPTKQQAEKEKERIREILLKCNAVKEPDKKDISGHSK